MTETANILVPMDGSPAALRALRHVARSRRGRPVHVLVLNVQPGMPPSRHVTRAMIAEYQATHGEAALKPARELATRLKLDAEYYVRSGDAAREIAALARETGCQEIVMGTRGLSRLGGVLLGSVASKVVHLAGVPVTLVK
ncbi:MAG: universal stress protein [Chromatiales bacterium]|jgi:nucleotide-binding universal stress UspA family protein|nr:universal stress protein [Chromatiales bacterium]